MLDAHCHIDLFLQPNRLVRAIEQEKVTTIAVTNLPSYYEMSLRHLRGMQYIKPALGFHPLMIGQHTSEMTRFKCLSPGTDYIGEIGLDFSREGRKTKDSQVRYLREILQTIRDRKRFISLHARNSEKEVLHELVEACIPCAVFHWYNGSLSTLQQIIGAGYYFSVNTAMMNSRHGQRILASIPKDRLLTETDGPYIKIDKHPVGPLDIKTLIIEIAHCWQLTPEETCQQIMRNFESVRP